MKAHGPRRARIIIIGGFILAVGICYLLFGSVFLIERAAISGLDDSERAAFQNAVESILNEKRMDLFSQRNSLILFFTAASVKKRLLDEYPRIANLSIRAGFPNTVEIAVRLREREGIWCSVRPETDAAVLRAPTTSPDSGRQEEKEREECFFVDREGIAFERAPHLAGGIFLRVRDTRKDGVSPRKPVLRAGNFQTLAAFREKAARLPNAAVSEFILSDREPRIVARMEGGWDVYFSFSAADADYLIAALQAALSEIGEEASRLAYIDLRIPDRAYYAFRDEIPHPLPESESAKKTP